ncbi:MAG TPA: hypothetical protein VMU81_25625 [Acetobacteraceae bacterium]|nr:hypothetical protein [Acetobacteraceae bacterium]
MHTPTTTSNLLPAFRYAAGDFLLVDANTVPSWMAPALYRGRDLEEISRDIASLTNNEARMVDSCGEALEGYDIWKWRDEYCVKIMSDNEPVAVVVLHGVVEWLRFQPWLSALAVKVMLADQAYRAKAA